MNKPKRLLATTSRVLLNLFTVVAMIVLAGLIGVGGAALWIYGRTDLIHSTVKQSSPRLKTEVAAADTRYFPLLTPVQSDDETPAQLTPAHYVPTDSEIATVSDTPRYTYVSYDGGRQQAHLRVNTVLSASVPAPLAAVSNDNAVPAQAGNLPPLSDSASRYITNAQGRVIGIDGSAGAAEEAQAQEVPVARALPVQVALDPEVRVAAPVTEYGQPVYVGGRTNATITTNYLPIRKALPVQDEESAAPATNSFNVKAELAQEDDRPVLRAQTVSKNTRPARNSMFGGSDNFQSFGNN